MILKMLYIIISKISILSLLILISSIDYITRLALLIKVFIMSGLLYTILDKKFLGLTYIIVYVGAISILFLFVVMMTESGRSPNIEVSPQKKGRLVKIKEYGFRLDIFLLAIISIYLFKKLLKKPSNFEIEESHIKNYYISSYSSEFITFTDIESLGYILYLAYPIITVLIGILLWCVLIGILRISGQ